MTFSGTDDSSVHQSGVGVDRLEEVKSIASSLEKAKTRRKVDDDGKRASQCSPLPRSSARLQKFVRRKSADVQIDSRRAAVL